jgi:hypothetical protein
MFEDAAKAKGVEEKLKVMDIAEVVAQIIADYADRRYSILCKQ